jgi:E3 ubiquitin-protein ligase RNF5
METEIIDGDMTQPTNGEIEEKDSPYECSICYCEAKSPVLTQCGHLYCWPCIFHWLNFNRTHLTCPVCKSGISENTLIPIFCRTESPSTDESSVPGLEALPPRP